jgi:hypothetical protein
VLGDHPSAMNPGLMSAREYIISRLIPINGRYVLYDELIANAQKQYQQYLDASDRAKELDELLGSLDDLDIDSIA